MRVKAVVRAAAVAACAGVVFGAGPALAWGSVASVSASCWRPWLSSTATFGGDGTNYTPTPGGGKNLFYIKVDAYLKHNEANADFVRDEDYGWASARKDHGGVTGDRSWVVDAYGWQYPNSGSGQKHNRCVIT